jgi:polysaccharide chain length determinant protein (PEP-CTERM system associated)
LHDLSLVYTDNYPEVIEVKSEIETAKEQMKTGRGGGELPLEDEKIRMEMKTLNATEQNLRRTIASKRAVLRSIPAVKASLEELEREKESQKDLYGQLLARYGQSEVSKQMEVQDKATNFRIVDPAVLPVKPFSPNRVIMILLGILAGLVGGIAILVIIDYLDSSVRDIDTLKSLGVPVLAIVPVIKNPDDIQATKKRDILFFGAAATYFSLILAILSIEVMREFSINLLGARQIKLDLSQLKDLILK